MGTFKPYRIRTIQRKCGCLVSQAIDVRGYAVTVKCPHYQRTREQLERFRRVQAATHR